MDYDARLFADGHDVVVLKEDVEPQRLWQVPPTRPLHVAAEVHALFRDNQDRE
jgi:hypothetical protein